MLTIGTLHLPSLVLSLFSWSLFYFTLRRLEPQHKAEWHCRIVTVVHATLISLITAWATFVQGPWPFTDAGGPNTPLQVTAVTICVGYFLFDFAWCLHSQTEGLPMLLHHFLSIFGMFFMLIRGRHGTEMVATICGSELTNPLLQLRWFLRETGRYKTLAGEIVDFLFMTSFFVIRLILGSILLYCYFQQPTDIWGRLGGVGIYLISWMFWISIFQYAVYKYGKKYQAWQNARRSKTSSLRDREEEKGSSKTSQHDLNGTASQQIFLKDSHEELSGQDSSSSEVCVNGVFRRTNGGHSNSKDSSSQNGFLPDEGSVQR